MIKTLVIQNFQSHENTYLEFSPGVNIIIGSSDSGKTAIIRAMRWVLFNRPSGESIRSNWGGKTNVELVTQEGSVVRSKDKVDKYQICKSEKTIDFKAFGTSVPEEVSRFLNIKEINLQSQLDAPFLLSDSPGVVAAHFNKVAKLDKIDTVTQNINSELRQLASDIKHTEKQEIELNENLSKFDHLEKCEVDMEVLEEMDKECISLVQKRTKLETLITTINKTVFEIKTASEILKLEKPLDDIFKLKDQKEDLEIDGGDLWNIVKKIETTQTKITEQEDILTLEKPVDDLLDLYDKLKTANNTKNSLSKLLSVISNTTTMLNNKTASLGSLNVELSKIKICPFCGNKLK